MTIVTVGSVVGAPGATTTALAMARYRRDPLVLMEVDPDGGRLSSWTGVEHRPGTVELLASARALESGDPFHWVQRADTHTPARLVLTHPSSDVIDRALRASAPELARVVAAAPFDVVCDVGRYRPHSPAEPLYAVADWRLVVVRGDLADVAVASHALDSLRQGGPVMVVVTGPGPYGADEIADALGVPTVALPPVGAPVPGRRFLRAIDELNHRVWAGGSR